MARILAIDDEKPIVDIVTFVLQKEGHEVHAFTDADAGVAKAGENTYDLIILDMVLGTTSGYRVAARLQQIPKTADTPILFLSAKLEVPDLLLKNVKSKADFLVKPFKHKDLINKVSVLTGTVKGQ